MLKTLIVCGAVPAMLWAQSGMVRGTVVSHESQRPLANTIVSAPGLGRALFTNETGAFVLTGVPTGPLLLRIRRLGYTPLDITVSAGLVGDTLRIELTKLAVQLGPVTVRGLPRCKHPGPPPPHMDPTLGLVFTQLQMNADQYRLLASEYPFESRIDVLRTFKSKGQDTLSVEKQFLALVSSAIDWKYRPGNLIVQLDSERIFKVPTLVDFADTDFVSEHCFHYAGVDTVDNIALVRIDLVAADHIREPDVNGSMYLDPSTFQIRRSVLRLNRMPKVQGMTGLEVATEFKEIAESIPVISVVASSQTFDPKHRAISVVARYENWTLLSVKFVAKTPGK